MTYTNSEKGTNRERELVEMFWEKGFGVVRVPASGSATERSLPDMVAGDGDRYIAVEAKSSGKNTIYIDGGEVDDLLDFCDRFGAKARIGVRFDRMDWFFFHPGNLHYTDGGNYRVKKEKAVSEGIDFPELVGEGRQSRLGE